MEFDCKYYVELETLRNATTRELERMGIYTFSELLKEATNLRNKCIEEANLQAYYGDITYDKGQVIALINTKFMMLISQAPTKVDIEY